MARGKKRSVKVLVLPHAKGLPLPAYQTPDAAGLDLLAALPSDEPLMLKRGAIARIPTGLVLELPRGLEAQVRPRSGLAAKHGVTVLNSPGTIDSDYRGEIQVLLINHGRATFVIRRGERVAQMVIAAVAQVTLKAVVDVGATVRGAGGFGSTGTGPRGPGSRRTGKSSTGATTTGQDPAGPQGRPARVATKAPAGVSANARPSPRIPSTGTRGRRTTRDQRGQRR